MSDERWPLPNTWCWGKAGEIAHIVGGGTPPTSDENNFDDGGTPWITPADLTGYQGVYIARGRRSLSQRGFASCGARLLPAGTVLYSSRAPIGYCAIASNPIATNQGFKSFVLGDGFLPEFVRYYLLSSKDYAESLASGTTFKELSGSRIEEMSIPVAPTEEQRRIVAKLDNLTEHSKRAREELGRIPNLVERFRAAILGTAFKGEISAEWRKQNASSLDEWQQITLGSVCIDVKYGTSAKCHYEPKATPVLRIPNVIRGAIDTSDLKYASFTKSEHEKLALKSGDILVIRSNGSLDLVGRAARVTDEVAGYLYAGYLIRLRLDGQRIHPAFVQLAFEEPSIRREIESLAKSTSGVNNINSEQLKALSLPLPPLREQFEIVRHVEAAFAQIEDTAAEAKRARGLLERLDQAVLAKAFRGELVPQDPKDETASQLLARIRLAKVGTLKEVRGAGPRTTITPRAPREKAAMTKSRHDEDVKDKPYLATLLKEMGGSASVESLFKRAELPVTDFYKQLAWEVDAGYIRDDDQRLEAA